MAQAQFANRAADPGSNSMPAAAAVSRNIASKPSASIPPILILLGTRRRKASSPSSCGSRLVGKRPPGVGTGCRSSHCRAKGNRRGGRAARSDRFSKSRGDISCRPKSSMSQNSVAGFHLQRGDENSRGFILLEIQHAGTSSPRRKETAAGRGTTPIVLFEAVEMHRQ